MQKFGSSLTKTNVMQLEPPHLLFVGLHASRGLE